MKKLLVMVLAMGCFAASAASAAEKIAYVDTQRVFDETKIGKKYQNIVRDYFKNRKKILDADAEEIKKLQEDYTKQASVLTEKARREKEVKIREKMVAFEKKQTEFTKEVNRKNDELSKQFDDVLMQVLEKIAKKEKISILLNKTINIAPKAEVPAILYADEKLDLTDKVIAAMDKQKSK